ncbi:uncharacterized protein LOC110860579 isoform X2 [Folsomia candida]|uniref:uncharacterized protein LOC110860579 isoform X2 n=1 Tax=Folsomia candida TaxID=158441 RepID=UPI001604EE12|nr:uncharacterized protein LOC110860579 isoform X2 [Folsomia candida]
MRYQYSNQLLFMKILSCLIVTVVVVESSGKINYRRTPEKIFAGCLTTKFCYSPEEGDIPEENPNCMEDVSCKNLVAIGGRDGKDNNTEDQVVIEMYSQAKAWFSIGLSNDVSMGDDYVLSCRRPNISMITDTIVGNGDILPSVTNSWNKAPDIAPVGKGNKIITDVSNIVVVQTLVSRREIYCKFYMQKKFTKIDPYENRKREYDLSKEYCILAAWSDKYNITNASLYQLVDHDATYGKGNGKLGGRRPCKHSWKLDMFFQPTASQKIYFKVHGICMILTWICFVSIGNFVGSFYKDIFKKKETCFKLATWLVIHCVFHVGALIPFGMGIYFHVVGKIGWKSHVRKNYMHLVGGYGVVALYCVSLLSGFLLRKKKDLRRLSDFEDKVHYPTLVHKVSSHAVHFLSNLVLASSPELQFSGLSCHFSYVVIGWMITYIFLYVFMIFHRFWGPVLAEESKDIDNLVVPINSLLTDSDVEEQPETLKLKTIALYVFGTLAFLMAVSLISMLVWPPVSECFRKESDNFFEVKAMARYQKQSLNKNDVGDEDLDLEPATLGPYRPPSNKTSQRQIKLI